LVDVVEWSFRALPDRRDGGPLHDPGAHRGKTQVEIVHG
jgi:hypothetical protein